MGGPGKSDGRMIKSVDNFLHAKFIVDGIEYPSVENYFQCQKTTNKEEFEKVRRGGCGADVWMVGSMVKLRKDWEEVKVRVMYTGSKAKIEQHEELKKELLSTHGPIIFTNSTKFWCLWNGRISELVREELREPSDRNEEKIKELREQMEQYEREQKI